MKQADIALCLRPGTDGALASAIMHVLFRDGLADRAYLERYTDAPAELEAEPQTKTPEWAAAITGLSVSEIEDFARLIGTTKRTFFRIGYGFSRQRNGAVAMHAVLSIPAVSGAWQYEGGGAFHSNSGIFGLDDSVIEGRDKLDRSVRQLDQSRTAHVLTGDVDALKGGPPVTAMIIQNTNPVSICPDQTLVKQGFAREDLFVAVHEQIMTDTARMADIVLPATMFLEHDDIYKGGGHQYIIFGGKQVDPPEGCRTNHQVITGLARRLGLTHPGFEMTERELIDQMLRMSKRGTLDELEANRWIDCQTPFERAHFLDGFGHGDRKFHFRVNWTKVRTENYGAVGPVGTMPEFPDHWGAIESADDEHPFRLATSPSRSFLNSSFNETPGSISKEGRPELMIHPDDASALALADGGLAAIGNKRGTVRLHARYFEGLKRGVVISEGIWANSAFEDGNGINTLTGADPVAPFGGAAVHDTKVWIRAL